jgi:predicted short-subunit dehydrogenase-like oxidoreductase (DUF2520 family)
MNIVIIGSGNTATVLGAKLLEAGHKILQVISRQKVHAGRLAEELHAGWSTDISAIQREADFYLAALSDDALYGLGDRLSLPGKLIAHTAGTVPREVLAKVSGRNGVFYPLQSLRKEIRPFPEIPILIDAAKHKDLAAMTGLARTISGNVREAGNAERLKLHLAATMVNNFTNYLYTLAAGFCHQEKVDFSLLLPLIRETAGRLSHFHPRDIQTGPAIREDESTIQKHLDLLYNYPEMTEFYKLFTNKIEAFYHPPEIPRQL